MAFEVTTVIDPDLCVGCGQCVEVCPMRTISLEDGKAVVTGTVSLNCGHCMAVCPEDAVKVESIDEGLSSFATFEADKRWLPHGQFDTPQLVRLMASRRSCRNYLDRPVDRAVLDDLVKIGITAPSGTNSQLWTFTIVPTRQGVSAFTERVGQFFERLNRMAEKSLMRSFMKLIGKPELDHYYREYYAMVKEAMVEWRATGRDRLFHAAPALIVIASKPRASTPKEDALLAAQNILLAAHSMGLGSCLIGLAVSAMKNDRTIQRFLGIPDEEEIHAVITLGYPNEEYQTCAGRYKVLNRCFEG